LAFHPYPPLIRSFCNRNRFGRPARVTAPSAWRWVAHPVSGLLPATNRPIRTRFRSGSGCRPLSLATEKQLAGPFYKKYAVTPRRELRPCVSMGFQDLFHPPRRGAFHLSLTVLGHYRSCRVFSLGRWSPQLPTGYFVPGRTQEHQHTRSNFPYPAITVYGGVFQTPSGRASAAVSTAAEVGLVSYNPSGTRAAALACHWFGRFPVRSPLLRGYCLFLGLREMFQLARCPPQNMR